MVDYNKILQECLQELQDVDITENGDEDFLYATIQDVIEKLQVIHDDDCLFGEHLDNLRQVMSYLDCPDICKIEQEWPKILRKLSSIHCE